MKKFLLFLTLACAAIAQVSIDVGDIAWPASSASQVFRRNAANNGFEFFTLTAGGLGLGTTDSPTHANLTLTGDLAVNGGDITSTAGIVLSPTGTNVIVLNQTALKPSGAGTGISAPGFTIPDQHGALYITNGGSGVYPFAGETGNLVIQARTNAARDIVFATSDAGASPGIAGVITRGPNRNWLLGTTTDSGNGKLQLATHTTSAGGIGFGTDLALFRSAAGQITLDPGSGTQATTLNLVGRNAGVAGSASIIASVTGGLTLGTNGSGSAVTIASTTGNVAIASSTASTSTTSGALTVAGGLGVAGNGNFGGSLSVGGHSTSRLFNLTGDSASIDFAAMTNTNATNPRVWVFGPGTGVAKSFTFRDNTGAANVLVLYDASAASPGQVSVQATTNSTSATTGALVVAGGLGVAGAGHFGGPLNALATAVVIGTNTNNILKLERQGTGAGSGWIYANSADVFGAYDNSGNLRFSVSQAGVVNVPNTTEATTGGAGSFTTAGGIYAAKKIVGNSDIIANGVIQHKAYTVATLPAAASYAGGIAYVTDANATTRLSTVAGGGANKVMVFSDGTNWLIL